MANLYKRNSKAMVCSRNTCITVYGDAARAINTIVVTTVAILAIATLVKALK
jgi:hypothetical protein